MAKHLDSMDHIHSDQPKFQAVIFHGYGADMTDLSSLAQVLDPNGDANWYFPNGFLDVPIGPGFYGKAWFNINIEEFDEAVRTGKHRDMSKRRPKGLDEAAAAARAFIEEKKIDWSQLVLGGFSQGAMLATELVLSSPQPPKALVVLSGALLDEKNWKEKMKLKKGLKFFASHGTHDPILSYEGAQDLEKAFVENGWEGSLETFRGGHEIPQNVLQNLTYFLKRL